MTRKKVIPDKVEQPDVIDEICDDISHLTSVQKENLTYRLSKPPRHKKDPGYGSSENDFTYIDVNGDTQYNNHDETDPVCCLSRDINNLTLAQKASLAVKLNSLV